ncbi:hypothetical protein KDA_22140 [Dictyobacter alpinus]|uniref:Uncharacterized protein n=1 Tax=Dictyobacter alpinus TaxID=2014873 RepID=A0A402B5X2_9CHLR|nr:hypothetical protein KDA_22140 [Dictyobacter alpinus]
MLNQDQDDKQSRNLLAQKLPTKYGVILIIVCILLYFGIAIGTGKTQAQVFNDLLHMLLYLPVFIVVALFYHYFLRKRI